MQPDDRRLRKRRKASALAKMYFKKGLSIFPGYPIRQEGDRILWQPVGADPEKWPEARWISREELREAQAAWTTLVRRFPRAIYEAIDNAEAWKKAFPPLLERLRETIHHRKQLPAHVFGPEMGFPSSVVHKAERLAREAPALIPLLGPISWLCCFDPERANPILSWMGRNQDHLRYAVENLSEVVGEKDRHEDPVWFWLRLAWRMPRLGAGRLEKLLHLLGDPRILRIPTAGIKQFLYMWKDLLLSASRYPVIAWGPENRPPRPLLAVELLLLLEFLVENPIAVQCRVLDLLNLILPDHIFDQWEQWWKQCHLLLAEVQQLGIKGTMPGIWNCQFPVLGNRSQIYLDRLEELAYGAPMEITFIRTQDALEALRVFSLSYWKENYQDEFLPKALFTLASPERKNIYDLVVQMLSANPSPSFRMEFVKKFVPSLLYLVHRYEERKILSILRELLKRIPREKLFLIVQNASDLDDFFDGRIQNDKQACEALSEWLELLDQSENLHVPVWVSQASPDSSQRKAILLALATSGMDLSKIPGEVLSLAVQMIDQVDELLPTVKSLQRIWKTDWASDSLEPLIRFFRATPWLAFLREAIQQKQISLIEELAKKFALAEALEIKPAIPPYPAKTSVPEWAQQYPEPLHSDLALLAAVSPKAQSIAEKILRKDFPSAEGLRQEIATLESLVPAHPERIRLSRRLENLRARLQDSHRKVSSVRLEHLRSKIRRAIRQAFFRYLQESLQNALSEAIQRMLGVCQVPDWIWHPLHQNTFLGILKLRSQQKWAYRLGVQLLRRRCGPPPWRPWDAKPNQRFLHQLRKHGIDPEPWVSPAGPVEAVGDNGRRVWLALEQDPLEIIQLGTYLNTCLIAHPNSMVFFALIVTAVDANKQVLYARDEKGRVIGRCLLTISEDLRLLTYHPYCHDPHLNFRKLVSQFVTQLAKQMNISVAFHGNVPCLLGKGWKSDEPEELPETSPFWQEGPSFREHLHRLPLPELDAFLDRWFTKIPLEEAQLCRFLRLPELINRPEVLLVLLPRIRRPGTVSTETYTQILDLFQKVNFRENTPFHKKTRLFIRRNLLPLLIRLYRQEVTYDVWKLADPLLAVDAWSVLRLIRATRPQGVRRDKDEKDQDRRRLLAKAFTALGRHDLAQTFSSSEQ